MTKHRKRFDNPAQTSLFDLLIEHQSDGDPQPGSMDIDRALRESVSRALRMCPLSRYQVAAVMSELVGQDITKSMLDSWTAESHDQHRFPAIFLPAFCHAVGNNAPLKLLGSSARTFVMDGPDALRADIQKDDEIIHEVRQRRQKKLVMLKMMEGDE